MSYLESLIPTLPKSVQIRLEAAINIEHNPEYHPEGSVFNHIRIVVERCAQYNDKIMIAAAVLHDICKVDTAKINPKTGYFSFIGHEVVAAKLIASDVEIQNWIGNFCGFENIDTVREIVYYHMMIHKIGEMRAGKVEKYKKIWNDLGIWEYLIKHSAADNMLVEFDAKDYNNLAKFNK
jgi:hypothetical protein